MNFFISDAMAQAAGDAGGGAGLLQFLPLIVIFVIFYFLLIRPQQKRQKEHKKMTENLKKGDEVVTNGGLLGTISSVGENFITLDVAEGVTVRVQRVAVNMMMPKGTIKSAVKE